MCTHAEWNQRHLGINLLIIFTIVAPFLACVLMMLFTLSVSSRWSRVILKQLILDFIELNITDYGFVNMFDCFIESKWMALEWIMSSLIDVMPYNVNAQLSSYLYS